MQNKKINSTSNNVIVVQTEKETTKVNKNNISSWIPNWREKDAIESLKILNDNQLSEILPVWYKISDNGLLLKDVGEYASQIVEIAEYKKIEIMPTMTNVSTSGFSSSLVSKMLDKKEEVVDQIINEVVQNSYVGWDLDLEQIDTKDKNRYVDFIKLLSEKLKFHNRKLSVTLHAQDGKNKWYGVNGQNMYEISKYADEVRIMAYDFHNQDTRSGPITPKGYLEDVIEYTLENVDRQKIVMSLPSYGYNWSNTGVRPMQFAEINDYLLNNHLTSSRDAESSEMYINYKIDEDRGTIWYQDYESIVSKVEFINKYEIYNICLWHLGGEDGQFWKNVN